MENIGRAFGYMFEDRDWLMKILIGGAFVLLSCILIGIPFLLGYFLVAIRNASDGKPVPLPAWDNLGDKFVQGIMFLVVIIIWMVPLFIVNFLLSFIFCIGWLISIAISLLFALALPYIYVRFARSGSIGDALDFSGIVAFVQKNFVNLLLVVLIGIALAIVASLGVLALLIGYLFTSFWAMLGNAYLYGEVWRVSEQSKAVTPQP